MTKPNLFYFVHAHGNGHKATFHNLYPELSAFFNVVAITTNNQITQYLKEHYDIKVLELPPKYPEDYEIPEHTFSKAFEVTPYATEPAKRAKALANAVEIYQPKVLYCDGVPELAIMVRGMGVPVVLIHLPGNIMKDPTQVFAHELADHIVAHFPSILEQNDYQFGYKTFYSGYLSQYSRSETYSSVDLNDDEVTILLGYDNYDGAILKNITENMEIQFTIIGNKQNYDLGPNCKQLGKVRDIRKAITGKVVITAAGQNSVAELLSLGKQLILLPEPRPYNEQQLHANALVNQNIAFQAEEDFSAQEWQNLLQKAFSINTDHRSLVNASAAKEIAQKMKTWYA